jgi:hypothetical protein
VQAHIGHLASTKCAKKILNALVSNIGKGKKPLNLDLKNKKEGLFAPLIRYHDV